MGTRILVVEADPDVAGSLYDILGQLDIPDLDIDVATSFKLGLLQAETEGWDVIIAQERLPDGSGPSLLARMTKRRPATRRVLMAASPDPALLPRAVNEAHIDLFIQLPWKPAAVKRGVEQLLRESGATRRQGGFGRIPPVN